MFQRVRAVLCLFLGHRWIRRYSKITDREYPYAYTLHCRRCGTEGKAKRRQ